MLERVYDLDYPGANSLFENLPTPPEVLEFVNIPIDDENGPQAIGGGGVVFINANHTLLYINSAGEVVDGGLDRVLVHELVHALLGYEDIPDEEDLSGSTPNPDYLGDTVRITNEIMGALSGQDERLSYADGDVPSHNVDYLQLGQNWTGGGEH